MYKYFKKLLYLRLFILKFLLMKKIITSLKSTVLIGIILFPVNMLSQSSPSDGLIPGMTVDNYPKVDGSTSNDPLNTLIACKLLGFNYAWEFNYIWGSEGYDEDAIWSLRPRGGNVPPDFFGERVKTSQTHRAFLNVIDGEADIILTATRASDDEKEHANGKGVTLIETPIALDAFVFLTNKSNTMTSLTEKQIQDIYSGRIVYWNEVGGNGDEIYPYIRNRNSGSQELMEKVVMKDVKMPDWPTEHMVSYMQMVFQSLIGNENGISYTVYYYKEYMLKQYSSMVNALEVNGIYPDSVTIKNRTYPYTTEVYAVIRSDLDRSSQAYKLYEWLQTDAGKEVIAESGYIPISGTSSIPEINDISVQLYPNPVTEGFFVTGLTSPAQLVLYDTSGRSVLTEQLTNDMYINFDFAPPGLYIAKLSSEKGLVQKKILKK